MANAATVFRIRFGPRDFEMTEDRQNVAVLAMLILAMVVIAASGLVYLWHNPALEFPRYVAPTSTPKTYPRVSNVSSKWRCFQSYHDLHIPDETVRVICQL